MAAVCPTCRDPVREIMRVYNVTIEAGHCLICLQPASSICVFVPCGHPICSDCSRQWVARLHNPIRVPGGPATAVNEVQAAELRRGLRYGQAAHEFIRDDLSAASMESYSSDEEDAEVGPPAPMAAPWLATEPFAPMPPPLLEPEPFAPLAPPWLVPEPFAPAPGWAPIMGELFLYHGRLAHWAQVYRFWHQIVLLWSDSDRLCKAGNALVPPPGLVGHNVVWHVAGRGNSKWMLFAEVLEV